MLLGEKDWVFVYSMEHTLTTIRWWIMYMLPLESPLLGPSDVEQYGVGMWLMVKVSVYAVPFGKKKYCSFGPASAGGATTHIY